MAEALRLRSAGQPTGARDPAASGFLDADHRVPFEEILAPFVLAARERLARRTATFAGLLSVP